jgi:hypothetical protein
LSVSKDILKSADTVFSICFPRCRALFGACALNLIERFFVFSAAVLVGDLLKIRSDKLSDTGGGDKSTQEIDIKAAKRLANE